MVFQYYYIQYFIFTFSNIVYLNFKRVKVTHMDMKGTYWSWVTGYHLMYSDDGSTWQGYKESSATSWKVYPSLVIIVL